MTAQLKAALILTGEFDSDATTKGETVHEPELTPTGLLDSPGRMIYRAPEPIGFKLRRDRK